MSRHLLSDLPAGGRGERNKKGQKCIMFLTLLQVLDGNEKGALPNECYCKHRGALTQLPTGILGRSYLQGSFIPN